MRHSGGVGPLYISESVWHESDITRYATDLLFIYCHLGGRRGSPDRRITRNRDRAAEHAKELLKRVGLKGASTTDRAAFGQ